MPISQPNNQPASTQNGLLVAHLFVCVCMVMILCQVMSRAFPKQNITGFESEANLTNLKTSVVCIFV